VRVFALLLILAAQAHAEPPVVREALDLELDGRLGEALERYRAALASEPALVQDEAVAQDLTVRVLSKSAHLCIDLGYGEEASDFAARLAASKNPRAQQEGAAIRARLLRLQGKSALAPVWTSAPASWVKDGSAAYLPSPADALGLTVQDSVRIQVGAFKDWNNALTLIDMLREKGWAPLTDVKAGPAGPLHTVYVVSRQPAQDRARLAAQGLLDSR
jgi:hypothetical protein